MGDDHMHFSPDTLQWQKVKRTPSIEVRRERLGATAVQRVSSLGEYAVSSSHAMPTF
jgi:hypothetical protein